MLVYADPFSTYGTGATGRANLVLGNPFIANDGGPSTTNPRVGGTHAWRFDFQSGASDSVRYIFPATIQQFRLAYALNMDNLPSANNEIILFQPRDSANGIQCTVCLTTTGAVALHNGDEVGTVLGTSAALAIVAGTYQHLECYFDIADAGHFEARVNGVTVLSLSGVDTKATAIAGASAAELVRSRGVGGYYADFYHTDTTGTNNNDWLGDIQWVRVDPNLDKAATDWTRNTGATDFSAINQTTPDGDTTYVQATASGQVSQFGCSNLPALTSEVVAVIVKSMVKKVDSGDANYKHGLVSDPAGAPSTTYGADRPITTAYTYYNDVFETDPKTGVLWLPAAVNAADLIINRSV